MAKKKIVIMGVHGLVDQPRTSWHSVWAQAVRNAFATGDDLEPEFRFITYDPIFEKTRISGWATAKALRKVRAVLRKLRYVTQGEDRGEPLRVHMSASRGCLIATS